MSKVIEKDQNLSKIIRIEPNRPKMIENNEPHEKIDRID